MRNPEIHFVFGVLTFKKIREVRLNLQKLIQFFTVRYVQFILQNKIKFAVLFSLALKGTNVQVSLQIAVNHLLCNTVILNDFFIKARAAPHSTHLRFKVTANQAKR